MKISVKLNILNQMNKIYDDFIKSYYLACGRLCAHCCTRNVTLTTLEGYNIVKYIESFDKSVLLEKVKIDSGKFRYTPIITTNQLAQMGYEGKDIPDEDTGAVGESCPILENDECPIYDVRPFGCKCLVSKRNCKENGYAEIDPFVVTVNNIFYQFIEHIDENGFFGNFTDVLLFLETRKTFFDDETNATPHPESGLIKNHPLKVLLIPPEHREEVKPLLESLQNIRVPKEV
ncbi:MAG: YkgJ family cysteine cluster protein [Desulfobacterales bacterium]|nr:YkgJ family cysteine cluster protein [Desulfobacterales bacterium]